MSAPDENVLENVSTVTVAPSMRPPVVAPPAAGDPGTLVIFGAAGDLARRKLLPAVYDLARQDLLAKDYNVLGVGLESYDDNSFRDLMKKAVEASDEITNFDAAVWDRLAARMFYVSGNLGDNALYEAVKAKLAAIESKTDPRNANRLFYLAIPPSVFEMSLSHLSESGLAPQIDDPQVRPWRRIIVEKPFGRSLKTALALNRVVLSHFAEHQVFRIDHYLGKETVQNILVLRTANLIFEPLWNRNYISHVQITAAETVGVEARGKYYEEAGCVRDMFQNHLMQMLALTAMELPIAMSGDAVRDEKVKVLKCVRPLLDGNENVVLGQYEAGHIKGQPVPAYRAEPNVAKTSVTPTYAAIRMMVDNYRWKGVPFFLRSGKRMNKRVSEIAIQFRRPPHLMLGPLANKEVQSNELVIRVQPNDGISMRFEVKVPGAAMALTPDIEVAAVDMNFNYADAFGADTHPAYETLLLDCMIGDATLFTRSDEVEAAWRLTDPLLESWERNPPTNLPGYAAGNWGPAESDAFIGRDGFAWRTP